MTETATVRLDSSYFNEARGLFEGDTLVRSEERTGYFRLGQVFWGILFPSPVLALFNESLNRIGPEVGLRPRLSLDEFLVDLPWELLSDPSKADSFSGFLPLNPRVSLVRAAPRPSVDQPSMKRVQRLVFAGAKGPGGEDPYRVDEEFELMKRALEPVKAFIDPVQVPATLDGIDRGLATGGDIFHYAGKGRVEHGRGILECDRPLEAEALAGLLGGAQTKLAVLNTCFSGRWAFARSLLACGLPALIGSQSSVTISGAISFCEKLYSAIAVGASVDEAVALARRNHYQATASASSGLFEWSTYVVFLPATQTVLFPKPDDADARRHRQAVDDELNRLRIEVNQYVGPNYGTVSGVSAQQISTS
jgi:hypothetical protein